MNDVKLEASKVVRATEVIRLVSAAVLLVAGVVILYAAAGQARAARRAFGSHDDCPNR